MLVHIQRQRSAQQDGREQEESRSRDDGQADVKRSYAPPTAAATDELMQSGALDDTATRGDPIQAELDRLSGSTGVDKGSEQSERNEKPGEEPSPG